MMPVVSFFLIHTNCFIAEMFIWAIHLIVKELQKLHSIFCKNVFSLVQTIKNDRSKSII